MAQPWKKFLKYNSEITTKAKTIRIKNADSVKEIDADCVGTKQQLFAHDSVENGTRYGRILEQRILEFGNCCLVQHFLSPSRVLVVLQICFRKSRRFGR
jgi:hypothetical protein